LVTDHADVFDAVVWHNRDVTSHSACMIRFGMIIYSRINSFKKMPRELTFDAKRLSPPSERLAFAHANSQSSRLVDLGLKVKK
jgi:hypothetical protein